MFHILLDTEVFRRENLHFTSKRFQRLIDLVQEQQVTVYVTDITIGEVRKAIASSVHTAVEFLKPNDTRRVLGILAQAQTANLSGVLARLDEPSLVQELSAKFDLLLNKLGAIPISTDKISVAELRQRYFEALPPFSSSKKHEFPDALSILAAEIYANDLGTELYIVSADANMAEATRIPAHLEHIESLQAMIGLVLESGEVTATIAKAAEKVLEELAENVAARVKEEFLESGFYVEGDWYGEVDEVEVDRVDVWEPTVAEVNGAIATLEFGATIDFAAEVMIGDPAQTARDSETGDIYVYGHLQQTVYETVDLSGSIEIEIKLADLSKSRILSVSLYPSNFGLRYRWPDD